LVCLVSIVYPLHHEEKPFYIGRISSISLYPFQKVILREEYDLEILETERFENDAAYF
jgi:hypothetical protein